MTRSRSTWTGIARLAAACVAATAACEPSDDDSTWPPDGEDWFAGDADASVDDGATDRPDLADPGDAPDFRPDDGGADEARPDEATADEGSSGVDPPLGGSSGGSGGPRPVDGDTRTAGGTTYRLIVPSGSSAPLPFLVIYSGTEGGATMTSNIRSIGSYVGIDDFAVAVLDGVDYFGDGDAAIPVIDDVRGRYDIDNDRTYLLSESAGTSAGLELGFHLRQSYFAAFWANDVNYADTPGQSADELGFAPWGNAGPGGDFPDANAIVSGMRSAGYRLPSDAPYSGAGSDTHGSTEQFLAACEFFVGKSRR
jgi:hypothetical protein